MSNLPWRWIINKKDGTPLLSLKTEEEANRYMDSDLYDVFPVYKGDPEAYNNLESNLVHNEYVRVPVEMNTKMRCILRMYSTDPAGIWEELLKASNPETTMEIKK